MKDLQNNRINKRAVFFNTGSQILFRIVAIVLTLISVKLLTSYLGAYGVGKYNTIITYINFFVVIADLGLFSVTVREISKRPEEEKKIISNVIWIRLISVVAASAVAIGIAYFTKYDWEIKIGTVVATGFLIFNLLGSVYDAVLQHRLKMQYSALSEFIAKTISILALAVIIFMRGSFLSIIATSALFGFFIFLFKWILAKKYVAKAGRADLKTMRWIFNLAWPLGIVFIINNLYFKLDTLLLFIMKGAAAVGIYSVAYKVLEVTAAFGAYFASALKPSFSKMIKEDKPYLASIVNKSILVMIYISAPIAIISALYSREIILFLSTPEFVSGGSALVLLGFALPLIYLDVLLSEILIANDERKKLIKISITVVLFNLVANLIVIPRYSFVGAAATTLLSELLLFIINYSVTKKILKYKINLSGIMKIIAVSLITFALMIFINKLGFNFFIGILIALLIYLTFSSLFNIVSIKQLKSLLKPS